MNLTSKQREELAHTERLFERLKITPVDLQMADRPDIRFTLDGQTVGLEVTVGDPEEYRRVGGLQKKGEISGGIFTTDLHDEHGERRSNDDLKDAVQAPVWQDFSEGWAQWARKVRSAFEAKHEKLKNPEFEKFDNNWLLICGIVGPGDTQVDFEGSRETLERELAGVTRTDLDFDLIYIHFGDYLFCYESGSLSLSHRVASET